MCVRIWAKEKHHNGSDDDENLIRFHKTQWDQLSKDSLSQYTQNTVSLLGDIELPEDNINCSGVNCDNHIHNNHLSVWARYALPVWRW